jgi:membrane protease YdiL (CAAX protease family)
MRQRPVVLHGGADDTGRVTQASTATVPPREALSWKLLSAVLLSGSAVLLFGFEFDVGGYSALAASLITALVIDRQFARHVALIAVGLVISSAVPLNADLSIRHMLLMGGALALAVVVPYVISRFGYRDHLVRFPVLTGRRWPTVAKLYLIGVVALGYFILPFYLISTGVYLNWPDASDPSVFVRLFIGVNSVGIWDELFFVCTTFTLLRHHFPDWLANILQAVIFSSFLWEIGYESWGPLLTFPFAMLQGYTFKLTKSLTYVVSVHLIFDLVLFLALVHAHNRDWLPVFLY